MLPNPWHVGHAPNGLLNENSRGCGILVRDAARAALEALAEHGASSAGVAGRRPSFDARTPRRRPRDTPSRSSRSAACRSRRRSICTRSTIDLRATRRVGERRRRPASSSDTARPSTSSRPKPLRAQRRRASSASRIGRTAGAPAAAAGGSSAPRRPPPSSSSSSASPSAGDASAARRRPACRSRSAGACPAAAPASWRATTSARLAHDFAAAAAADTCGRRARTAAACSRGSRSSCRRSSADCGCCSSGGWRWPAQMPSMPIDVGLLHPLEELPGVGRQRLDVAALAFGVDRVEGERRLARPAHAGDDDEPAVRQRQVDVLQVVRARAANDERTLGRSDRGRGRIGHRPTAGLRADWSSNRCYYASCGRRTDPFALRAETVLSCQTFSLTPLATYCLSAPISRAVWHCPQWRSVSLSASLDLTCSDST